MCLTKGPRVKRSCTGIQEALQHAPKAGVQGRLPSTPGPSLLCLTLFAWPQIQVSLAALLRLQSTLQVS